MNLRQSNKSNREDSDVLSNSMSKDDETKLKNKFTNSIVYDEGIMSKLSNELNPNLISQIPY